MSSRLRRWFVRVALAYLGTPYRWGGDDPTGFDCSGLVVECLKSVGLLSEDEDLSADGLWQRYRVHEVGQPCRGALIFFLNKCGQAHHVGVCLDECVFIEAGGGDRRVVTSQDASTANAFVKVRPIPAGTSRTKFVDVFGRETGTCPAGSPAHSP